MENETKLLRCDSEDCIHNKDGKCACEEITIGDSGYCEQEEIDE